MIAKDKLGKLYSRQGKSMQEIAERLGCSVHKVTYWMGKYGITTRSISEAIYLKKHPKGDPFSFRQPSTFENWELYGFGLGLYWGEGTKADRHAIRLGNSNPGIILKFMEFLVTIFNVEKKDFKFGLQLFTDINQQEAIEFWTKMLNVESKQFYKTITTISGSLGTYRKKVKYGVLTLYYHNKKLRDLLESLLPM